MKPAKKIERLIKKSRHKVSPEAYDKALGSFLQAVDAHEKQKSTIAEPKIWRIIMKSNITKLATAAVIIIAIMLGMYALTGSFDGTSITMAQVREAMDNVDWMQLIAKSEIKKDTNIVWYSFARKVEIVNAKPGISYSDFKSKKDLFWRRDSEYIYESPIETKEFAYGTSGPFEMIDKTLSLAQAEHGKDIVKEIGTYQNQKVEIWTASHVKKAAFTLRKTILSSGIPKKDRRISMRPEPHVMQRSR
jgi:hypothetical protein